MRVLTVAMVALALVASTAAEPQIYVVEPAPVVIAPPVQHHRYPFGSIVHDLPVPDVTTIALGAGT